MFCIRDRSTSFDVFWHKGINSLGYCNENNSTIFDVDV